MYLSFVCTDRRNGQTHGRRQNRQELFGKKSADVESKITEQANGKRYVDGWLCNIIKTQLQTNISSYRLLY